MFWSSVVLAAREIRRNLFRSGLTVLGIVIGVAAVVAIVTIGNGATARITGDLSSLGANMLIVSPGSDRRGPGGFGARGRPFSMDDVGDIRAIPEIDAVAPTHVRPALAITAHARQPVALSGTTADYATVRNLKLASGEWFGTSAGSHTCVLGPNAAESLFGDRPPLGGEVTCDGTSYTVAGVLAAEGRGMFGSSHDDAILVPIATLHDDADPGAVDALFVTVTSPEFVEEVRGRLREVLRERRGLEEGQRNDFRIHGVDRILDTVRQTTGILTAVIGSIAGISLLVGGIGIMNVMLVTITERTREIGVRMAIGAQSRDVMLQFLVESSMLTGFGGLVGIALGSGGGLLAAHLIELPFRPDGLVLAGVFLFSVLLGLVFGLLPARRAARLNPVDALRHE